MKKLFQTSILVTFGLCLIHCGPSKTQHGQIDTKFKMASMKMNTDGTYPLAWENKSERKNWSRMIYSVIENETPEYFDFNNLEDITLFCPQYKNLDKKFKMNFWGQFITAISAQESSWNPLSKYTETSQGIDPITGFQSQSEGLLQLSYKDQKNYKIDCGFDWEMDQSLPEYDIRRSILDPYQNLRCGMKILSYQLKKHKKIIVAREFQYWNVLNSGKSSLNEIKKLTLDLPFCSIKK